MKKIARIALALAALGLLSLGISVTADDQVTDHETVVVKPAPIDAGPQALPKRDCAPASEQMANMTPMAAQSQGPMVVGGPHEATFCDSSLSGGTSASCEAFGLANGDITCANGNTPRSINCSLPGGSGCPSNTTKCTCSWSCRSPNTLPIG